MYIYRTNIYRNTGRRQMQICMRCLRKCKTVLQPFIPSSVCSIVNDAISGKSLKPSSEPLKRSRRRHCGSQNERCDRSHWTFLGDRYRALRDAVASPRGHWRVPPSPRGGMPRLILSKRRVPRLNISARSL